MSDQQPASSENPLTLLERRVLSALAQGTSSREVAAKLNMRHDVVLGELASIMTKLGARSRLDAIVTALRRSWIDIPN
jgi:two-component system response regulator DesR